MMLPGAANITGPPLLPLPLSEVSICPTEMLPGEDLPPDDVKVVPPTWLPGTLGALAKVVKPAFKIRAGLVFKI
jgi:hypothetical protein